jgi:hypothetical protein
MREEEMPMTRPRPAPIRPLGVAEILDGAVRLVRGGLRSVLTISVPLAVVRTGLGALMQYAAVRSQGAATFALLGGLVLAAGFGTVLTGLLAPLFSSALLGTELTARESLRRVGRRAGPLLLLALAVTVAEGAGLVVLGVGGVWLWGVWAVAAPALVLERTGVPGAFGRSMALVRGTFWRVWGVRALGWLLVTVLSFFVTLPFQTLAVYLTDANLFDPSSGVSQPALYVALVSIGGLVSTALLAPVSAAVDVVLYTDLRMRKEGMDIVLGLPTRADVSGGAGAGRPAVTAW